MGSPLHPPLLLVRPAWGEQLRQLRIGEPSDPDSYLSAREAAAALGLSHEEYADLEAGRASLHEADWARVFRALHAAHDAARGRAR